MNHVVSIQFTHDQTRTLTGVSAETVRHWRKAIPYLASKSGKSARFTFSDLMGFAVTYELVNSLGVNIATLSAGVDSLFRLLADSGPASLDGALVYITATDAILSEPGTPQAPTKPTLVVPLAPLMARIQGHVLPTMPVQSQKALPFPLEAVRNRA